MRQWIKEGTHCQGREGPIERLGHAWQCPSKQMTDTQAQVMVAVKKLAKENKTPQHIREAFCHVLQCEMDGCENPIKATYGAHLQVAMRAQQSIGTDMMMQGFLTIFPI